MRKSYTLFHFYRNLILESIGKFVNAQKVFNKFSNIYAKLPAFAELICTN